MRLQETRDSDAAATELREFVSSLFQSEVDVSPHDRAVEGRFFDEIVFTRQIPIEFSPIEKWSLAELWTRASGLTGGTSGIDPTHMGRWNYHGGTSTNLSRCTRAGGVVASDAPSSFLAPRPSGSPATLTGRSRP